MIFFIHFTLFYVSVKRATVDIRNRPRIPIPDEDPYSVAGNGGGSSGSSGGGGGSVGVAQHVRRSEKPPKLPPRGDNPYPHDIPKVIYSYFCVLHYFIIFYLHQFCFYGQ